MENQTLIERLQNIEARLVAKLGMETAVIAMENIDIDFYKQDYFLIQYVEELVRKYLPFPNKISGSVGSSRYMANAKRAYAMILVNRLGLKKRQVAALLNCGWRNIYNLYNDGKTMLEDTGENNQFKQRYNMILHEYNVYIKNYGRTPNS